MKALNFLLSVSEFCGKFQSQERPKQKVSTSELRRWFDKKSIIINNLPAEKDQEIKFPITSLILFPKSATQKRTLW